MRTNRELTSFLVVALIGTSISGSTLAQMARATPKPPNRGPATNHVDLVLDMKDGKCTFTATPNKVWAHRSLRDKVKWDVTNHCNISGKVEIFFPPNPNLPPNTNPDPFASCNKITEPSSNGGHKDFTCQLRYDVGTGMYPYKIRLGTTELAVDPDVEVWD